MARAIIPAGMPSDRTSVGSVIASSPPQSQGQAPPRVRVSHLRKIYRTRRGEHVALEDVSLEIAAGEILVLLGPSGCGKTTLLRCVAGLEQPDAGEIEVQGQRVFSAASGASLPPEARGLSMVFQSYALWPHMTVLENVAYPLRNTGVARDEARERVNTVLRVVGLERWAAAYPGQLSGGQQQRVAVARAIVGNEGVILFDEPLSNLDAKVRERLRLELLALHRDIGFSALYVTHDQTEATALADRIAVMDTGLVAQVGTPAEIYYRPMTRYVAGFIGSANEVPGRIVGPDGSFWQVETPVGPLHGTLGGMTPVAAGQPVTVLFRPEHCRIGTEAAGRDGNRLRCRIDRSIFLGSYVEYLARAGDTPLVLRSMDGDLLADGTEIEVCLAPDRARIFPAV